MCNTLLTNLDNPVHCIGFGIICGVILVMGIQSSVRLFNRYINIG